MKTIRQYYAGFTLVELIVVISIGAILSTLGFVMYVDYLKGVRDNSRVQQLHGLQAGLNLYATQSKIPLPDKGLRIKYGDYPIGYQGYLDQSMREAIHYSDGGFDPKSQKDYTVFISRDRKRSQVMAYLEEQQDDLTLTADIGEYQGLYPYVVGDELGILIHTGAMVPIQDVEPFSGSGEVDVSQSGSMLSILALLSNELAVSAADDLVFALVPKSSCESIKLGNPSAENGFYYVNPTGKQKQEVYCLMEEAPSFSGAVFGDGGWTLVARSHPDATAGDFGWFIPYGSPRNDADKYSLGSDVQDLGFDEIMIASYTGSSKQIQQAIVFHVDKNGIKNDSAAGLVANNCQELIPVDHGLHSGTGTGAEDSTLSYPGVSHTGTYRGSDYAYENNDLIRGTGSYCDYRDAINWGYFKYISSECTASINNTKPSGEYRQHGYHFRAGYSKPAGGCEIWRHYGVDANGIRIHATKSYWVFGQMGTDPTMKDNIMIFVK